MSVSIEPIGNITEIEALGNRVEVALYDVFTQRYMLTQFQIDEVNEEVRHGTAND